MHTCRRILNLLEPKTKRDCVLEKMIKGVSGGVEGEENGIKYKHTYTHTHTWKIATTYKYYIPSSKEEIVFARSLIYIYIYKHIRILANGMMMEYLNGMVGRGGGGAHG